VGLLEIFHTFACVGAVARWCVGYYICVGRSIGQLEPLNC